MARARALAKVFVAAATRIESDLLAKGIIQSRWHCTVVGHTTSISDLITRVGALKPDVVLVTEDLEAAPLAGFRALTELKEHFPAVPVVMLLKSPDSELALRAFRKGASGVYSEAASADLLAKCLHCVAGGEIWASKEDLQSLLAALMKFAPSREDGPMEQLTRREQDVATLVAQGMSNQEIATQLHLSAHTVKNYLFRAFEKTGASNRAELAIRTIGSSPVLRKAS